MSAELDAFIKHSLTEFDRAIDHLQKELQKVRTGKASTNIVDGILVNYYGFNVLINQVANISLSDSRIIAI